MANIHPSAVVAEDAQLAEDVVVGPFCIIGRGAVIGAGTTLLANVVIEAGVNIGQQNVFYSHATIGAQPQMLGAGLDLKSGGLIIGDRNVFREQVTVHRSLTPGQYTRIGNDNLLMVSCHIGHDCVIEDKVVLTNLVQLAGHCKLEVGAWLSGLVGVHQFARLNRLRVPATDWLQHLAVSRLEVFRPAAFSDIQYIYYRLDAQKIKSFDLF